MEKKYDINDLVNAIPTLLNNPLGSLVKIIDHQENEGENTTTTTSDPEMDAILRAEEVLKKRKEALQKKRASIKEQIRVAVKEIEEGSINFNKLYSLIEQIKN